jgi:phage FluMu protein Com
MVNALECHERDQSSEGSGLLACECPRCKMVSWLEEETRERKTCPFCSTAQPDYVTRTVPETMKTLAPEETTNFWTDRQIAPAGDCDIGSPFVHEFFMVQGSGFRCMAYRNQDGKWRGAFDDEELPGAIRVLG